MSASFYVKNYRNLKELHLDSLAQINLISGKNNTGKSSLLEAIHIYANKGSVESIVANLDDRKEYGNGSICGISSSLEGLVLQENIKALSSLFHNRQFSSNISDRIEIGRSDLKDLITLRFVHYEDKLESDRDNNELIYRSRIVVDDMNNNALENLHVGFEIRVDDSSRLLTLQREFRRYTRSPNSAFSDNNQFIHTNNINDNSQLFDRIALSDKEKYIIDALKIIEPNTERIAFVEINRRDRVPVIKLSNAKDVIFLSSMGDGINRILTIILALVNSDGGYLLIDEFENGLHYTVQEQLWAIIFKLAKELNIRVFATTHSNDCIASFNAVLQNKEYSSIGKYIRLDNVNGCIKQVGFSSEELNIAEQQDIEIR